MPPTWFGTLLVTASVVLVPVFVPGSPLDHPEDPSYWGVRAFLVTVLLMLGLRAWRGPASAAERAVLCVLLALMPAVYVAGAVQADAPSVLAEVAGFAVFAGVAAAGWFGSAQALGVGLIAHGMLWDAWHHDRTTIVASWYPVGCLYVDVALGVYVLGRPWDGEGEAYWRRHAKRYDRFTLWLSREFPAMARAVGQAVAGRDEVLELAAGTGLVTVEAARGARRYVATDGSAEMLAVLRERARGAPGLEARVADATRLAEPDAAYDAVIVANLLHLVPGPERVLAEALRVLRPGGLLLAPTFCHGAGPVARTVSALLAATGFPVVTRFRGPDVDALVTAAGFEVVDARSFEGLLPVRFVVARRP